MAPFSCGECGKEWSSEKNFKKHIGRAHGTQLFICDLCDRQCPSRETISSHIFARHPGFGSFKCKFCQEALTSSQHLETHVTDSHGQFRNDFCMCDLCDQQFTMRCNLVHHINRAHVDADVFKCDQCDKEWEWKGSITVHIAAHHQAIRRVFKCKLCPATYACTKTLNSHMATHRQQRFNLSCDTCDKLFWSKNGLEFHIVVVHGPQKSVTCALCSLDFSSNATLRNHMRNHHSGKSFQCDHCGLKCNRRVNVCLHIVRMHMKRGKSAVECAHCALKCSKYNLKSHIERMHRKKRPFMCDVCFQTFGSRNEIVSHQKGVCGCLKRHGARFRK